MTWLQLLEILKTLHPTEDKELLNQPVAFHDGSGSYTVDLVRSMHENQMMFVFAGGEDEAG